MELIEPQVVLRDYFAGLAMQSMFTGEGARMVAERDQRYDETNWADIVATNAYDMADAMLKARQPRQARKPKPDKFDPRDVAILGGDPSL